MRILLVNIGKDLVEIDRDAFESLLDISPMKEYKAYTDAEASGEITLKDLKRLALKAGIPYPLFFASRKICQIQLGHKNKNIFEKFPFKDKISMGTRGKVKVKDIELIIADIGRKQETLKRRVLTTAATNTFIGSLAVKIKKGTPVAAIADGIRKQFKIDLSFLRTLNKKEKVLDYIRDCIEREGIFVSFSSHNYMPQNLDSNLLVSGICIKDQKFPFIFINTRDGDENPRIIESEGRQIFTLLSMLVCVGMNKFILTTSSHQSSKQIAKLALEIASEIIIPELQLPEDPPATLDELRRIADYFCVTPSMLLYQLERYKKLEKETIDNFRGRLAIDLLKNQPKHRRAPRPVTGYSKYNGKRFSREIVKALLAGKMSQIDVRNILFRKGKKMDQVVWSKYIRKFNTH